MGCSLTTDNRNYSMLLVLWGFFFVIFKDFVVFIYSVGRQESRAETGWRRDAAKGCRLGVWEDSVEAAVRHTGGLLPPPSHPLGHVFVFSVNW